MRIVAYLHDTYYDAKATLLSEANIKEIRKSRGRIPNASKKMADKFHIGFKRIYEIWDNKERLQQEVIPSSSGQPVFEENFQTDTMEQNLEVVPEVLPTSLPTIKISKKNGWKKKVKTDEKSVTEITSITLEEEKNENKNNTISFSDNSSDISRESRLENLVKRGENLKSLTVST